MAQRNSTYDRKSNDLYTTPPWVTRALIPHIPHGVQHIWEPAAGVGRMVDALNDPDAGRYCFATDLVGSDNVAQMDFLGEEVPAFKFDGICTNPPFSLAHQFIIRALQRTLPTAGFVAMLLRTDFDHAKSRVGIFRDCRAFHKKLVLTKRIVWFVDPLTGKPKASPSENHSWFIWDWSRPWLRRPATLAYYVEGPRVAGEFGGEEDGDENDREAA